MLPVVRRGAWFNGATPDLFAQFHNDIDTFFNRASGHDGSSLVSDRAGVPIAVWEDEDRFFVEAEMPGFNDSDVEVTVHDGRLLIRGERSAPEGRNYLYNSRAYGTFQRIITLPATVNADEVTAEFSGGMLTIQLPKRPEAKPKKITLQAK
jgi:HSP20 family protein